MTKPINDIKEIIQQEKKFLEQEKKDNEMQLKLNLQIMQILNEKPVGVMGCALNELNQRKQQRMRELDTLERDIKTLKDKEGTLLIELQKKYKCQWDNLQAQRDLITNEHKLLLEYQTQIEDLRRKQKGVSNLQESKANLETLEKQSRQEYKVLYDRVGTNKQLIQKLREQLDKHIMLKKRIEDDPELNELFDECLIEVTVDRGSKIVTRAN